MKNHFQKIKTTALLFVFVAIMNKGVAQVPLACPYVVTKSRSCSVFINWEVQDLFNGSFCPTLCSGQRCIPAGSNWTVPAACCAAGYDVIVTVIQIDATNNCSGNSSCLISTTVPCASGVNCPTAGNPNVNQPNTVSCCGNSGYTVTWSTTGITIN